MEKMKANPIPHTIAAGKKIHLWMFILGPPNRLSDRIEFNSAVSNIKSKIPHLHGSAWIKGFGKMIRKFLRTERGFTEQAGRPNQLTYFSFGGNRD